MSTNSKIKLTTHVAFGFRNLGNLAATIMLPCPVSAHIDEASDFVKGYKKQARAGDLRSYFSQKLALKLLLRYNK